MNRILLTGFMGCGKSVTGAQLATRLSIPFIDLDERVSKIAEATVEQIFTDQGEEAFRTLESSALTSIPDHVVCALGGGTLMNPDNLLWSLKESWLIYLRVGIQELVSRLENDDTVRPILRDPSGDQLPTLQMEIRIRKLLKEREKIYIQAHQILDVDGIPPDEVAKRCLQSYESRNDRR